jgi:hypothetical protein
MSNCVKPSAIPWTERVCEEFEKQTGVKLLFDPPRPGERERSTEIHLYTKNFEFREFMGISDEFMESGNENVMANILAGKYQNKSS